MAITWKMDPAVAGACLLTASEVPNFLAGALPSFMTIGRFAAEPQDVDRLEDGMRWATVPIIAVGVGSVLVFESWWPGLVTLAVYLYYRRGYHRHMYAPNGDAQPIDQQGGY